MFRFITTTIHCWRSCAHRSCNIVRTMVLMLFFIKRHGKQKSFWALRDENFLDREIPLFPELAKSGCSHIPCPGLVSVTNDSHRKTTARAPPWKRYPNGSNAKKIISRTHNSSNNSIARLLYQYSKDRIIYTYICCITIIINNDDINNK